MNNKICIHIQYFLLLILLFLTSSAGRSRFKVPWLQDPSLWNKHEHHPMTWLPSNSPNVAAPLPWQRLSRSLIMLMQISLASSRLLCSLVWELQDCVFCLLSLRGHSLARSLFLAECFSDVADDPQTCYTLSSDDSTDDGGQGNFGRSNSPATLSRTKATHRRLSTVLHGSAMGPAKPMTLTWLHQLHAVDSKLESFNV